MARCFLVISLSFILACGHPADDDPVDERDAPFTVAKADGALSEVSADVVAGVLAFVNDGATTTTLLDVAARKGGVGLDRRAAENIAAARPFVDLAALDAVSYVGPYAFEALRAFACGVRRLCEPDLTLVSWNLEQFPLTDETVEAVAREITHLEADVVAVQEVADAAAFWRLVAALPAHEGLLAEPGWYTGVGIVFRRGLIRPLEEESLFVDENWAFPRPALRLQSAVGAREVTFIVVHLKAQVDEKSESRRRSACEKLDAYIDARPDEEIIVLGDFNDRLEDEEKDNVFTPFLAAPTDYSFLTRALADEGSFSYIAFRSLIDHILVTDEVLAGRGAAQTFVPRLDLELEGYREDISDHLPVVSVLHAR